MKGANALLAILILLMAVSPCGDVLEIDTCADSIHYHFSNSNVDHESLEDICSPFCSCTCCSIPLSNSGLISAKMSLKIRPNFNSIVELQVPSPPFKIWQPPKI